MAKMVGYECEKCGEKDEELFNDTEEKPEYLDKKCEKCGGRLKINNLKSNCHRWKFADLGGV